MQIILLHPRFNARTVTLSRWHLLLAMIGFAGAVLAAAAALHYLATRQALRFDLAPAAIAPGADDPANRQEKYMRENLAAMAVKLGEMQAQLTRLDALGERVQGLAGVKPQEFNFRQRPARGGIEQGAASRQGALDIGQFQQLMDALASDVERRADYLNVIESALMEQKVQARLLPTIQPVNVGYNASGFGWRLDPLTGRQGFHEGIDFAAAVGTPIIAAAGGVVIAAEYHPQFGNLLEIDHGNDMLTRYAHAARLLAKVGDIVRRGQHVADIGSTGRSTGPHLHFEVLVRGVPQNPHKFLAAGVDRSKRAAPAPG